jgi:hypothetical protein
MEFTAMYHTSFTNMPKSSTNFLQFFKKTFLSSALILTFLNPSLGLAQHSSESQQLQQRLQYYNNKLNALQAKLVIYVLANPQPSSAVLASGAGVAAILDQSLDSNSKAVLAVAGMFGAFYCADQANFNYCARVASNLSEYAIQIDSVNHEINAVALRMRSLQ